MKKNIKVLSVRDMDEALLFLKKEQRDRAQCYWTMKNGEKINIKEMSDEHLENTINMLETYKEETWIINSGAENDF